MKKLISILLFIILCFNTIGYCFAIGTFEVNAKYDRNTDSISISGMVHTQKGDIPLTVEVINPDGQFAGGFQTVAKADKSGNIVYEFEPIKLPLTAKGGTYTFNVSGHFINDTASASLEYLSGTDMLSVLTSVINASSGNFYNVILQNAKKLDLDIATVQSLDLEAQKIFNVVLGKRDYTLPGDAQTEMEILQVQNAYKNLCWDAFDALKIAQFNSIKSQADLNAWLDECYTFYDFDKNSDVTEESEEGISFYLRTVKGEKAFLDRICALDGLIDFKSIKSFVYSGILLSVIETQNDYNVFNVINNFTMLFPVGSGLSSEVKSRVCNMIARKHYASYSEVVSAFEKAEEELTGTTTGKEGKKDSSWGNSGGDVFTVVNKQPEVELAPQNVVEFSDLSNAQWAVDAISYLSRKKIVAGQGGGLFAPDNSVSRAEFIKMLICAKEITINENESPVFSDVAENSWYAGYFAAARREGLIQGDETGCAMPEEYITRQDMAVLLFRTFGQESIEKELIFADSNYISGYAKNAVAALVEKGVITGVGDNKFAPLAYATRAQAAQMLYKILV